jgi:hypothetical protein
MTEPLVFPTPPPLNPECAASKHAACFGDAWDHITDEPADCGCSCHTERNAA